MQEHLRDCREELNSEGPASNEAEVIDLTSDSDREGIATDRETAATKIAEGPSLLREIENPLVPIQAGHSVSGQRCVRTLGRLGRNPPYWIPSGVRFATTDHEHREHREQRE